MIFFSVGAEFIENQHVELRRMMVPYKLSNTFWLRRNAVELMEACGISRMVSSET